MPKDPKDLRIITQIAQFILLVPVMLVLFLLLFTGYSQIFIDQDRDCIIYDRFPPEAERKAAIEAFQRNTVEGLVKIDEIIAKYPPIIKCPKL